MKICDNPVIPKMWKGLTIQVMLKRIHNISFHFLEELLLPEHIQVHFDVTEEKSLSKHDWFHIYLPLWSRICLKPETTHICCTL